MIGILWFILISAIGIIVWRFYAADKRAKREYEEKQERLRQKKEKEKEKEDEV